MNIHNMIAKRLQNPIQIKDLGSKSHMNCAVQLMGKDCCITRTTGNIFKRKQNFT